MALQMNHTTDKLECPESYWRIGQINETIKSEATVVFHGYYNKAKRDHDLNNLIASRIYIVSGDDYQEIFNLSRTREEILQALYVYAIACQDMWAPTEEDVNAKISFFASAENV